MASFADELIEVFDGALRALFVPQTATRARPTPVDTASSTTPMPLTAQLTESERRHAASLMRVDHVGEVCAQALYAGQAMTARDERVRSAFVDAAREEGDHLAWTASRLEELGARPSLLNPLWYAGSFAIGWVAGKAGDAISLGFVVETERQVEEHLTGHLEEFPENDRESRAIVEAMRKDEIAHAQKAEDAGATELPPLVRAAMRAAAKVMTSTAYWI